MSGELAGDQGMPRFASPQSAIADPGAANTNSGRSAPMMLLTLDDLRREPAPDWLIEDVLVQNSFAVLFGAPASYKTFAALSMACSIATGVPWFGSAVQKAPVVYVAAEGSGGLLKRVDAWERAHGAHPDDLLIVTKPVHLLQAQSVFDLIHAIAETGRPPGLIVIDTLARCFQGGDENSARDVGLLVGAVDHIRNRTSAALILLHHQTKATGMLRGSTALDGAADTILSANVASGGVRLSCAKQKEAEPFPAFRLATRSIALPAGGSSIVLSLHGRGTADEPESTKKKVLRCLAELGAAGGTSADWRQACEAADVSVRSFYRLKDELEQEGAIVQQGRGRSARYRPREPGPEDDAPVTFSD